MADNIKGPVTTTERSTLNSAVGSGCYTNHLTGAQLLTLLNLLRMTSLSSTFN